MNDDEFSNDLTPAETERLALLMEEMGEAIQAAGKILRHWYRSFDPTVPVRERVSNREILEKEVGDVIFAVSMMLGKDLGSDRVATHQKAKAKKIKQYLHHQEE